MNLDRSETQTILQQTVRGFLEQEVPFDRVRGCERDHSWDDALWNSLTLHGWLGLALSEENGGAGGSMIDIGVMLEEFARRAAIVPVLEVLVCARTLQAFAPESIRAPLLAAILAGEARPTPAILEAEDDFESIESEVKDGKLSGAKRFVDHGQFATHYLVPARDGGVLGLYLVDGREREIRSAPLRSIGRTPVASVQFDSVGAQRIGDEDAFRSLLLLGRALASIQCLGGLQQALDMTVEYAKVREQFGKPIGSFQAVRHHCANMATRVAAVRILAYEALSTLDSGRPSEDLVNAAKAAVSQAAPEITMLAHQIHGGNGVIEENDLYFFTLRSKERAIAWGSHDECLDQLARRIDEPVDWL